MKVTALVLVMAALLAGSASAQEADSPPRGPDAPVREADAPPVARRGNISLQAGGSLLAPVGVEAEKYLGSFGLAVETRLLVRRADGQAAGSLEPGLNTRYYFDDPKRSLFLFAGAGVLTLWDFSPFSADQVILKVRAGLGHNWLTGEADRWRFGLEVGAVWLYELMEGDQYDIIFPVLPHFLLLFGRAY
jgi:hypothetical protein